MWECSKHTYLVTMSTTLYFSIFLSCGDQMCQILISSSFKLNATFISDFLAHWGKYLDTWKWLKTLVQAFFCSGRPCGQVCREKFAFVSISYFRREHFWNKGVLPCKSFALSRVLGERSQYKCLHKRKDKADYPGNNASGFSLHERNQWKDQGDNEPMLKIHDGDQTKIRAAAWILHRWSIVATLKSVV